MGAELLTTEEIKTFYDKLLNDSGYISILKRSINPVKFEQILTYARRVKNEALYRKQYKIKEDNRFDFPNSPIPSKSESFDYNDRLDYWKWSAEEIIKLIENKSKKSKLIIENFPDLPHCFKDKDYFFEILKHPKIKDLYTILDDGNYHWNKSKALLAKLAHRFLYTNKLNAFIRTGQDLARIFCPFFHITYNKSEEKQFQSNRSQSHYFDFIK